MRITGINNNANSVRVINHGTRYTKAGLLAYARNVNAAKYADIGTDKSILTHEIDGGAMSIKHKKPARKEHTLYIRQKMPRDWSELDCDEYLHGIIALGNDSYSEFNRGEYKDLFDRIVDNIILGDMEYDIERIEEMGYKNATEYINDVLWVNANTHQVGKLKKVLERCRTAHSLFNISTFCYPHQERYCDEDIIADVLTIFTPHKWESTTITGSAQREWADIVYPADIYNSKDIEYFEAYYFGKYMDYEAEYNGESAWYTFCDFEGEDAIIKAISGDYDTSKVEYTSYY